MLSSKSLFIASIIALVKGDHNGCSYFIADGIPLGLSTCMNSYDSETNSYTSQMYKCVGTTADDKMFFLMWNNTDCGNGDGMLTQNDTVDASDQGFELHCGENTDCISTLRISQSMENATDCNTEEDSYNEFAIANDICASEDGEYWINTCDGNNAIRNYYGDNTCSGDITSTETPGECECEDGYCTTLTVVTGPCTDDSSSKILSGGLALIIAIISTLL